MYSFAMASRTALRSAFPAVLCLSFLVRSAQAATPAARESERLHGLLDRAWESKLDDHPEFATYLGFPGHNPLWTDLSAAGIERRQARTREQLQAARSIDRSLLPPDEQVD